MSEFTHSKLGIRNEVSRDQTPECLWILDRFSVLRTGIDLL